jgi:hypothetical protein
MSEIIPIGGLIAQPAKCKICGKVIGHFELKWPDPPDASGQAFNQAQFKRLFEALGQHMNEPHFLPSHQRDYRHQQAMAAAQVLGGNIMTLFLSRHFRLPEAANGFTEKVRGATHHMLSKFKMNDADILALASATYETLAQLEEQETTAVSGDEDEEDSIDPIVHLLTKLRDQYEEGHPREVESTPPPVVVSPPAP